MISIAEFRSDKSLTKFAAELLEERTAVLMLEALMHDHPIRKAFVADNNGDISATSALVDGALQKGYQLYHDRLLSLAIHQKPVKELPEGAEEYKPDEIAKPTRKKKNASTSQP